MNVTAYISDVDPDRDLHALAGSDQLAAGLVERQAIDAKRREVLAGLERGAKIVSEGDLKDDFRTQLGFLRGVRWVLELREAAKQQLERRSKT